MATPSSASPLPTDAGLTVYGCEPDEDDLFSGRAEREASFHRGGELKHEADGGHVTMEFPKSASASTGDRASLYDACGIR